MKMAAVTVLGTSLLLTSVAFAQSTNLTRSEVAAIKAKLVTVQNAMGDDPAGYLKDEEDFSLPTEANPARGGKFYPITSSLSLRYVDRASEEGSASVEQAAEEFQAKYAAALASGNLEAVTKMAEELTRIQTQAAAAAMTPTKKENMQVYVQLNQNPSTGIDPDDVVLERSGAIVLRHKSDASGEKGDVTVYLDPVALKETEELSKVELRTPDDGVSNKTGVFHVVIQLNGTLADIEQWVETFDYDKMLSVIDPQ